MKLTVILLLLAAVSHAATTGKTKHRLQETEKIEKTEKRELVEGNSGLENRAPLLPTPVSPTAATGRVEYADTKERLQDQSPTQQIYATPAPQIAKISDVLTGQGPSYQSAIANHLYSPISVYHPRLGSPTTYEVSAPVPSQLAYSEHRLSVPSPNGLQYTKPQKLEKPITYEQPQVLQSSYDQNYVEVQPHQIPNNGYVQHYQSPIQYNQPQVYNQQQIQYVQEPVQQVAYGRQQQPAQYVKQPEQRDLKSQPSPIQILDQQQIHQQDYNDKQQNALSYARFTFNQGTTSHEQTQVPKAVSIPQPIVPITHQQLLQPQPQQHSVQPQPIAQINYQLQHPSQYQIQQHQIQQPKPQQIQQQQIQYQARQEAQQPVQYQGHQQIPQTIEYQQPQIQYQPQPQYVFQQPHLQQQIQIPDLQLPAHQYQIQPQYQQIQPQLFSVEKPNLKQSIPQKQVYFKQAPYQQQLIPSQDLSYKGVPALPTFPPVQYFGKFAQSIFADYQH